MENRGCGRITESITTRPISLTLTVTILKQLSMDRRIDRAGRMSLSITEIIDASDQLVEVFPRVLPPTEVVAFFVMIRELGL